MKLRMHKLVQFLSILLLGASCNNINLDLNKSSKSPTLSGPPNLAPAEEWVQIPANAGGMGLASFYVMKYEAKAMLNDESGTGTPVATTTHKPVSTADNQPWVSINANDSQEECESRGDGYHLISNPEWIAIARDIENVNSNWTGGSVGSGCIFRGNSGEDGTVPSACGYTATSFLDQGTARDTRARHTLSNGQEIYDISGNVHEWTDWDKDTIGFQNGPTGCSGSELNIVACAALADADYNTSNGGYTRNQGAGYFSGGNGGAALRGGARGYTTSNGVFTLNLHNSPASGYFDIGFRCVFRP